jgi:DNA-directed RNA polymerase subunit K/omega
MSDIEEEYSEHESVDEFEENIGDDIDVDAEEEEDDDKPIDEQLEKDDDKEDEDDEEDEEDKTPIEKDYKYESKSKIISKRELYNTETVNIIRNDERRTRPIVVSGELSAILAYRTANIERGGPYYLPKDFITPTNPIDIARAEFSNRLCPVLIMRRIGKDIELWDPNLMIHPRLDQSSTKH